MNLRAVRAELVQQGRGVAGALLVVGTTMLYTMEMTWLGWQLPPAVLLAYTVVGMAVVLVATKYVGFRRSQQSEADRSPVAYLTDFTELLLQGLVTAYVVLFLLGRLRVGDPPLVVVRLGLMFVVPLAFGASLANELLVRGGSGGDGGGGQGEVRGRSLVHDFAIYVAGSVFVTATIAPTEEVPLYATTMGWPRHAGLVVTSVLVAYLMLFELEFQGQDLRVRRETPIQQWGTAVTLYAISLVVSLLLLAAFGQVQGDALAVAVQEVIVLGLPASIGASAATVVLS